MIKKKLFGTDGIRDKISADALSVSNVARLGQVLGSLLDGPEHKKRVLVANDSRASGVYLSNALQSGLLSLGVDVENLGVLTTPALAYLTKVHQADLGIMISASHNPFSDNGLKIFDYRGFKIDAEFEGLIEERFFSSRIFEPRFNAVGSLCLKNYRSEYISFLLDLSRTLQKQKKISVVIDCAHGAATILVKELFSELCVDVIYINDQPSGTNINENAGSEHPSNLVQAVLDHKADIGIAFDGDADRVLFVDGEGAVIDGDAILFALAVEFKSRNMLAKDTLVATVMSSKGLDIGLMEYGINVVRADVGDRNVSNMMQKGGFCLGGENSGHIILGSLVTTGDGLLSALFVLSFIVEREVSLKNWCKDFQKIPSMLLNISVKQKYPLEKLEATRKLLDAHRDSLANDGRILMRYSGTQMLLRLFVESPSEALCQRIANELATTFEIECQNL